MLNFLLKTIQNKCTVNSRGWATTRKKCRLAAASVSGCRACCSWATATASWKHRNNRPSASSFQLVETAWNNFRPTTFWDLTAFWHNQMGQNFRFHLIFVRHFVHVRGDYLGFTVKGHKLLSICRNTKSQDDFSNRIFSVSLYFTMFLFSFVWGKVSTYSVVCNSIGAAFFPLFYLLTFSLLSVASVSFRICFQVWIMSCSCLSIEYSFSANSDAFRPLSKTDWGACSNATTISSTFWA